MFHGKQLRNLCIVIVLVAIFASLAAAFMSTDSVANEVLKGYQKQEQQIYNGQPSE